MNGEVLVCFSLILSYVASSPLRHHHRGFGSRFAGLHHPAFQKFFHQRQIAKPVKFSQHLFKDSFVPTIVSQKKLDGDGAIKETSKTNTEKGFQKGKLVDGKSNQSSKPKIKSPVPPAYKTKSGNPSQGMQESKNNQATITKERKSGKKLKHSPMMGHQHAPKLAVHATSRKRAVTWIKKVPRNDRRQLRKHDRLEKSAISTVDSLGKSAHLVKSAKMKVTKDLRKALMPLVHASKDVPLNLKNMKTVKKSMNPRSRKNIRLVNRPKMIRNGRYEYQIHAHHKQGQGHRWHAFVVPPRRTGTIAKWKLINKLRDTAVKEHRQHVSKPAVHPTNRKRTMARTKEFTSKDERQLRKGDKLEKSAIPRVEESRGKPSYLVESAKVKATKVLKNARIPLVHGSKRSHSRKDVPVNLKNLITGKKPINPRSQTRKNIRLANRPKMIPNGRYEYQIQAHEQGLRDRLHSYVAESPAYHGNTKMHKSIPDGIHDGQVFRGSPDAYSSPDSKNAFRISSIGKESATRGKYDYYIDSPLKKEETRSENSYNVEDFDKKRDGVDSAVKGDYDGENLNEKGYHRSDVHEEQSKYGEDDFESDGSEDNTETDYHAQQYSGEDDLESEDPYASSDGRHFESKSPDRFGKYDDYGGYMDEERRERPHKMDYADNLDNNARYEDSDSNGPYGYEDGFGENVSSKKRFDGIRNREIKTEKPGDPNFYAYYDFDPQDHDDFVKQRKYGDERLREFDDERSISDEHEYDNSFEDDTNTHGIGSAIAPGKKSSKHGKHPDQSEQSGGIDVDHSSTQKRKNVGNRDSVRKGDMAMKGGGGKVHNHEVTARKENKKVHTKYIKRMPFKGRNHVLKRKSDKGRCDFDQANRRMSPRNNPQVLQREYRPPFPPFLQRPRNFNFHPVYQPPYQGPPIPRPNFPNCFGPWMCQFNRAFPMV